MRACAQLSVGADPDGGAHRVLRMAGSAPLAWRSTPGAVHMVATAASPVADDDVEVEVSVGEGATLAIRSTAATVAWGGRGSRQSVTATVAAGGSLDWAPQPVIATARCDHHQTARVSLHPAARLVWSEEVVLGRHGEVAGSLRTALDVDVGERPLLRHQLRVGAGAPGWHGPAVLGRARSVGLLLVAGADVAPVHASGPGWALMPLDGPGVVGVAVGAGTLDVAAAMDGMRATMGVAHPR